MSYITRQEECGIEVDDTVLVYRMSPDYHKGWRGYFNCNCMDSIGKTGVVIDVCREYGIYVHLDKDVPYEMYEYFPYYVLKKVHPLYNQSKKFKKFENAVKRQERKILRRLTRA